MVESGLAPVRLLAWGLFVLGGLLWMALLTRLVQGIWQLFQPLNVWARYAQESSPYRRRRGRGGGIVASLLLFFLGALLVGAGWGLLRLEIATQDYLAFPSAPGQVARVECGTASTPLTCTLTLEGPLAPSAVTLRGVRWEITTEVLVWDPAWENFGLRSGYRLLSLVGRDAQGRIVQEMDLSGAAVGLGELAPWMGNRLPFVQARREMAAGAAEAGTLYQLYVSPAGFSVQKVAVVRP